MTLTSIRTEYGKRDDATYEKTEFTLGEHYRVFRLKIMHDNGYTFKDYTVRKNGDNYLPDIYFEDDIFSDEQDAQFKIQTSAYGALDAGEIQKVIEGYQEAIEAVKILNINFRHINK